MSSLLGEAIGGILPGLTAGVRTALPYLTGLSLQGTPLAGATIEALAQGVIPKQGPVLSANEIIRQVRAAGFGVNRQFALRAIRALKEQVRAHEYIQSITPGRVPLRSRVPLAGQRQTYPYHVRVAVTGQDLNTGELRTQYVTITSTRLIPQSQAQSEAALVVLSGEDYQMQDISGVEVVTYTRQNPGLQG